ncbi:hypothetical protein DEO72_LG5g1206 [Vigna unguiculata]|uniref:Uncharacterized protein n=1 Tax=Vigna unguiculata TaxID=3917 RepID=A0A4D6LWT4_VIGUN|nr:hypothetical protein DEO72_LG5g1206 [Vigna unguiculata]
MQWHNGVARRRRRRCSGGHEQPPPRCSGDATVVKPGRTIGVQWKICDAVWRMLGAEKIAEGEPKHKVHTASVIKEPRHKSR